MSNATSSPELITGGEQITSDDLAALSVEEHAFTVETYHRYTYVAANGDRLVCHNCGEGHASLHLVDGYGYRPACAPCLRSEVAYHMAHIHDADCDDSDYCADARYAIANLPAV